MPTSVLDTNTLDQSQVEQQSDGTYTVNKQLQAWFVGHLFWRGSLDFLYILKQISNFRLSAAVL